MTEATDRVLALLPDPEATEELVELLIALDDKERRALGRPLREARGSRWDGNPNRTLAVLACFPGIRQVASDVGWNTVPAGAEHHAVRLLAARRPPWLADLPAALFRQWDGGAGCFRLVRALVRAGLVVFPDGPEYPHAMVRGLTADRLHRTSTPLEGLRADAGLLDRELWLMLTTEHAGRTLTQWDSYWDTYLAGRPGGSAQPGQTWQHAVVTLAAEGALDRDRLLDVGLDVLARDWAAVDLAWHVGLHEALTPTTDDVRTRQAGYARLLRAGPGPVVTVGLRALSALVPDGVDLDLFLAAAPAVLVRPDKATVWRALSLMESVARARSDAAAQIAQVVATAREHPRADVRERVQALLTRLGADSPAPAEPLPPAAPVRREDRAPRPVEPTASADEVAELFARLIEEADDPIGVERVLDGVLRWAGHRPQIADALAARCAEVLAVSFPGPWSGQELRADLALLALVWLGRAQPGRGFRDRASLHAALLGRVDSRPPGALGAGASLSEVLTRRIHEVAVAAHGGGGVLLSLPTSTDGSLDAATLVRRIAALPRGHDAMPIDVAVAALRVPPERRDHVAVPRLHRAGRAVAAQLALLREHRPSWSLVVDADHEAHRREDKPWERRRPQPPVMWRDDAALPGGLDGALAAVLDHSDPLATFGARVRDGEYAGRFEQVTGCWPLLLPHHPEVLAAAAHPRLYRALTQNRSGAEPLLDALGAVRAPLGRPVLTALLLGLSARNGVEQTHAIDAVLDLIGRQALDGTALGAALGPLLRGGAVVGTRVAAGLAEVFRADAGTGAVLVDCLTAALPAVEGRRDAHLYLDLLADAAIAARRTVRLPDVFVEAARSKAKTQLARACRRVPQPAEAAT